MKVCKDCGIKKGDGEYYKARGYLSSYCKDCHKIRNLAGHAKMADKIAETDPDTLIKMAIKILLQHAPELLVKDCN